VSFSITVVLCFEMNAGPSTVLALTRPAKRNAIRDIGIESCSKGQKFDFRHLGRLGVLFVRPHVDYMQSQHNEEVESVSVFLVVFVSRVTKTTGKTLGSAPWDLRLS